MQRRYESIDIGSSDAAAIETLGKPQSKSDMFSLPQELGFAHYFDATQHSTEVQYLLWANAMNWYYCIGFDASGKAVIKAQGHS